MAGPIFTMARVEVNAGKAIAGKARACRGCTRTTLEDARRGARDASVGSLHPRTKSNETCSHGRDGRVRSREEPKSRAHSQARTLDSITHPPKGQANGPHGCASHGDTRANALDGGPCQRDTCPCQRDTRANALDARANELDGCPHPVDGRPNELDTCPHPVDARANEPDGCPYPVDARANELDACPYPRGTRANELGACPHPRGTRANELDGAWSK